MALGPQIKTKEYLLKKVEAAIDSYIQGSPDRVTIDVSLLPYGFSSKIWNELRHKYLKAGRKRAEYVFDQRDGDYLDFDV